MSERSPGKALVLALRGRTVVGVQRAEGMDDVRLLLDDGRVVVIDAAVEEVDDELLKELGLGPQGRLVVTFGGRELWPSE